MAIVLADLGPTVCCQGVGRQVVLGLVAKPVGGSKYDELERDYRDFNVLLLTSDLAGT